MENIPLWTFWENAPGKSMPPYLLMCHEVLTRQCQSADVRLVTPSELPELLGDLPINFDRLNVRGKLGPHLAQKADYIRLALLKRYGGIWLDADCIALSDVAEPVTEFLNQFEFVCMRKTNTTGLVSNGFLASRPNGVIISQALEQVTRILVDADKEQKPIEWNALGSSILTPLVKANRKTTYLFPEAKVHPIHFKDSHLFFERDDLVDHANYIGKETSLVMLYNARTSDADKSLPRTKILNSNTLIGQLFRKLLPDKVNSFVPATARVSDRFTRSDVDLIFTSVDRSKSAFRFIETIRKEIGPEIKITVAVQQDEPGVWAGFAQKHDVKLIMVGEDYGLSASRNECVRQTNRRVVFLCDDDFIFDSRLKFDAALDVLSDNSDINILGGMFLNQWRTPNGQLSRELPTSFACKLAEKGEVATFLPLEFTPRQRHFLDEKYFIEFTDTVNNFALMRRELFETFNNYWNEGIKILGEHEEFYIRLKRLKLGPRSVAYTNLLATRHVRESNPTFKLKRERTEGLAVAMRATGHKKYEFVGRRTDLLTQDGDIIRMGYPSWRR